MRARVPILEKGSLFSERLNHIQLNQQIGLGLWGSLGSQSSAPPCPTQTTLLAVIVTQPERLSENGLGPGLAGATPLNACSVARASPLGLCPVKFHIGLPAWKIQQELRLRQKCFKRGGAFLVAPQVQREAVVITKRQLRGKGHGGILACLRHLLRITLTHPMGLVKNLAQEEGLVLQQQCSQMLERAGAVEHAPLLHGQSPNAA